MTTWINRFIAMQPGDALLTISEDPSTLTALLDELRNLRNPPGEQDNSTLLAAQAVVHAAVDNVKLVRQKLRECEDRHKATINAQAERYRELRAELESALERERARGEEILFWRDAESKHALKAVSVGRLLDESLTRERLLRENQGVLLRDLSDILTGGNASTWDEVLHAATIQRNK